MITSTPQPLPLPAHKHRRKRKGCGNPPDHGSAGMGGHPSARSVPRVLVCARASLDSSTLHGPKRALNPPDHGSGGMGGVQ
jgi:hypothetical protein